MNLFVTPVKPDIDRATYTTTLLLVTVVNNIGKIQIPIKRSNTVNDASESGQYWFCIMRPKH